MNPFPWNQWIVLMAASFIGILASLPYTRAQNRERLAQISTGQLVVILVLQYGVLAALASALGLWLAASTGLGAPMLAALLSGTALPSDSGTAAAMAAGAGAASALLIVVIDVPLLGRFLPGELQQHVSATTLGQRLLVSLFGGIVEEILVRLGLMTGLTALLGLFWSTPGGLPAAGAIWAANGLAALAFGLGHLPATATVTRLTPLVILRTLLLNALGGVVFGWLYGRYGLLAAMLAHFAADVVLLNLSALLHPAPPTPAT